MKKVVAMLLVLVILSLSFASCGEKDVNSEVRVIKVWSSNGSTIEVLNDIVDEYNEGQGKTDGIKIEYEVFRNDYSTVIESATQNGQLPEVLLYSGDQARVNAAKKGEIIALEDMPGGKEFIEEYGEVPLDGRERIDGKTYFVNMSHTVHGLVYNKDLFKAAGLVDENGEPTPPKTTKELIEYAKKLTDTSKQVYGLGLPLKDMGWSMLGYPGYVTFNENSENGALYKVDWEKETYEYTDHWLEYIQFVKDVKNSGAIFPGAEGLDNDTMRAQFAAGRIGMFLGASWDVGVLTDQFPANCDWGVAPVPVYDGYERYINSSSRTSGYVFSNNALKCKEEAMKVYKYLMSDKVLLRLYEEGFFIPIKTKLLDMADESKFKPQWAQFANLMKGQTEKRKPQIAFQLEGESSNIKAQYVWQDTTIDASEYLPELKETYTYALRKGIKDKTIDKSLYIK